MASLIVLYSSERLVVLVECVACMLVCSLLVGLFASQLVSTGANLPVRFASKCSFTVLFVRNVEFVFDGVISLVGNLVKAFLL